MTHVNIEVIFQQSPRVESFTGRYTDNERCRLQYIDYFKFWLRILTHFGKDMTCRTHLGVDGVKVAAGRVVGVDRPPAGLAEPPRRFT